MKTILAATDLSDVSINAIEYAAQLAKFTGSKLILLHVYQPVISVDEIESDFKKALKLIEDTVCRKKVKLNEVESFCVPGFAMREISAFIESGKIDLALIGMQGEGYIDENFIGSFATKFIREAPCSVITVGKDVRFKPVTKMVLAYDYGEGLSLNPLLPLRNLLKFFNCHLDVLYIGAHKHSDAIPGHLEKKQQLADFFKGSGSELYFHFIQNENPANGINEFCDSSKTDMVVMIPHKYSFFEYLFHTQNTKQLAFHLKIPLLTLPE